MIYGMGVDCVQIDRVAQGAALVGEPYLARTFTTAERREAEGREQPERYLAGRFAVKEAAYKALGLCWGEKAGPLEMETLTGENGRPVFRPLGSLRALLDELGEWRCHVSLTYEQDRAMAAVLFELLQ